MKVDGARRLWCYVAAFLLGLTITLSCRTLISPSRVEEMEVSVVLDSSASAHSNTPGIHTPLGWKQLPIRFYISDDEIPPELHKHIYRAMNTWENVVGRRLFAEVTPPPSHRSPSIPQLGLEDEIMEFRRIDHSSHEQARYSVGQTTAGIAMFRKSATYSRVNPVKKFRLYAADVWFNFRNFYFVNVNTTSRSPDQRSIADLESVALHELGHVLGLTHVSADRDPDSIMLPSSSLWQSHHVPSMQDIANIHYIYGCKGASCDAGRVYDHITNKKRQEKDRDVGISAVPDS